MPVISMEGPAIPDLDKKRKLVRQVTEAAAEAYGLPAASIIILLKENKADNVSVGGQLISDRD